MTRVFVPCLLLALASAASADETHDLRKLIGRKQPVGERARVSQEESGKIEESLLRDGQPAGGGTRESSPSETYLEEVEAVGPDGEPTRLRRSYEAFKDDEGQAVQVEGIVVTLTRADGPEGRFTWAAAEGSAPLPPAIEASLRGDVANRNQRLDKGVTEDKINAVLFPAEAQPAGGTWSIEMAQAIPLLGFSEEDIDVAASTGKGSVAGVEELQGKQVVKARIEMQVVVKRLQGIDLPTPTAMAFTLGFALPVAGDGPMSEFSMVQHFDVTLAPPGAPPGTSVHVVVHNERVERRTTP